MTEWTEMFTDREEETGEREGKGKHTFMVLSIIGVWVWFEENQTERTSEIFILVKNRVKWEEEEEEEEVKMEANVFHG